MADLIAVLSSGKGTWGHVARLIQEQEWDNIFLISNDFGKEKFSSEKPVEFILVDARKSMADLVAEIKSGLEGKVKGTEVAINLVSGSGKEHMALLSVVMKLGLGFRLMALTGDGVKEL